MKKFKRIRLDRATFQPHSGVRAVAYPHKAVLIRIEVCGNANLQPLAHRDDGGTTLQRTHRFITHIGRYQIAGDQSYGRLFSKEGPDLQTCGACLYASMIHVCAPDFFDLLGCRRHLSYVFGAKIDMPAHRIVEACKIF